MRTVRRLYVYAVTFISLEIVVWGAISLLRSIICTGKSVCVGGDLSQGLAAVLVGIPFFLIHWGLAERSARRDGEERASGVRAVFLYGILLATLIPIVQNILAVLDHLALQIAGLSSSQAMFSANQTWTDNLIAIFINAVFAAYFFANLRSDWRVIRPGDAFADTRRLYRFAWLIYSLVIVVAAVQQLLRFTLNVSSIGLNIGFRASGAHGIVLALVGVPLWVFVWRVIQSSWAEPAERDSTLRLGMLYFLSLAGVITVLSSAGVMVNVILHRLLGEPMNLAAFISKISNSVSIGVPLAGVWAYYGHRLRLAIADSPDAPRRAGMRRLYAYILSAIGLAATFIGLALLLAFVVDISIGGILWRGPGLLSRLAESLATLLVGLPVWIFFWRPLQAEALASGDIGDHARRSLIRRIYLYLALFASVVGGMILAVSLVNMLLRSLFGSTIENLLQQALKDIGVLFLFVGLGLYHGGRLREDGRRASEALAEKHAAFPVLVFEAGDGLFSQAILEALRKQVPRLPVAVQEVDQPVPPDAAPRAVVLPARLALEPPESIQRWLMDYHGNRLAVPLAGSDGMQKHPEAWFFTGGVHPLPRAAAQAAQMIRQWAEGQPVRQESGPSGWRIVVYVLAALFGLEILVGLVSVGMSLIGRG